MYDREFILEYFNKFFDSITRVKIVKRDLSVDFVPQKCIVLIGPRRAGKTYFMWDHYKTRKNHSIYIDLEHSAFKKITHKDLFEILSIFEEHYNIKIKNVYLDEIQNLNEWESLVRSLLDTGYNVMVTGSSSKFLSKEVATQLRGRTLTYYLFPLSFREFLRFKDIRIQKHVSLSYKMKLLKYLKEFLDHGSYPEIVMRSSESEKILREYYFMVLYKDFIERFDISLPSLAKYIFEFCFQNYAKEISVNNISQYIYSQTSKKMKDKIYEYVCKLEDTSAVFFVSKLSMKVTERLSWPKKVYICDLGLSSILSFKQDIGKKMENVVFLELKRRENTKPLQEVYYYKTREGYEVDFLIKEGMEIKELMQVCYANSYEEIPEREIRALLHAKEELNLGDEVPLTVITWDYEDAREVEWWRKRGKIRFVPLWKWLLQV